MQQKISSSNIIDSADRRQSSNQENNRSTCYSGVTTYRKLYPRHKRSINIYFLQLMIFFCLAVVTNATQMQCADGLLTPGYTWPRGNILIRYNDPLKILCILNETHINVNYPGKNASNIVFTRDGTDMESRFITIVNKTTASLDIERLKPNRHVFTCKLRIEKDKDIGVCLNTVVIGHTPLSPRNLSCISQNWQNLTCKWTPPTNYVDTNYWISFSLPRNKLLMYHCPRKPPPPPNSCMWNLTTSPIYRQPYEYFFMTIHGENIFGSQNFVYKINHYANVIPDKPSIFTVVTRWQDSVLLAWQVPIDMIHFPPGFHHKIMYRCEYDETVIWKTILITDDVHLSERIYKIVNLPYPNAKYYVRLYVKSADAGEGMWSEFAYNEFKTLPSFPNMPPRINIGSFSIVEYARNRDLYVYWKPIPKTMENAENFTYQISYLDKDGDIVMSPKTLTATSAKIEGISLDSYLIEINSVNFIGPDVEGARMFIPSEHTRLCEPMEFTKTTLTPGTYELNWLPPVQDPRIKREIVSYTIFWCRNTNEDPKQCTSNLNWIDVSSDTTKYHVAVPEPYMEYKIAIAANTNSESSGMVWALPYTKQLMGWAEAKERNILVAKHIRTRLVGIDFIEVMWKQVCSNRVNSYNIYYCPVQSESDEICSGPELYVTIEEPLATYGVVKNLTSYTLYMLTVTVTVEYDEGSRSNPVYNMTLEDAPPTPPQKGAIIYTTDTKMLVSSKPPEVTNGIVSHYEVYYNEFAEIFNRTQAEWRDLLPFTMYNKSERMTKFVYPTPDIINNVTVQLANGSANSFLISWDEPRQRAGPRLHYEISGLNNERYTTENNEMELPITDCKWEPYETVYEFQVRAFIVVADGGLLSGPWSATKTVRCSKFFDDWGTKYFLTTFD